MLRRLKPQGANTEEILEIYSTQVRSVLEFAIAAWNSGLTKSQVNQIERVQKTAFAVILGINHIDYKHSLDTLKMESQVTGGIRCA